MRLKANRGSEQYQAELIARGAFTRALTRDIVGLYNDDAEHVLGRTSSGTMRLSENETGLAMEIDLPATTIGKDVYELVRRKDLRGCSFGFSIEKEKWNADSTVRTLIEVDLFETSIVAMPAYEGTFIEARSIGLPSAYEIGCYAGVIHQMVSDEEKMRLQLRLDLLRRL